MKKNTLTKVERQVLKGYGNGEGAFIIRDVIRRKDWPFLRAKMRRTAYHEAGHAAGQMFTGDDQSHGQRLTIIPTARWGGLHKVERAMADSFIEHYPPPLARCRGRCKLLQILAGRGAEARIAAPEDREDILDEDALWEEGEEEGTDLFRALRIADAMAGPRMPARRVLVLAEKWTAEMLALPDVWRCVETLAGMLLERGTIEDAEIRAVCAGMVDAWLRLPKWKRRLSVTKAEVEAMKRTRKRS